MTSRATEALRWWRTLKSGPSHRVIVAEESLDLDQLEAYLRALAYASRLQLLQLLHTPRMASEIRVAPRQPMEGVNPDRAISRQALEAHLEKLMDIGVVIAREGSAETNRAKQYVVNPQRLYQIAEEFRKVMTLAPGAPLPREETVDLAARAARPLGSGPMLILVHGLGEGRVFPLRSADLKDGRGWIVGRKAGLHVALEYDPFVSLENSEILREGRDFVLLDLRASKNGTLLNWRRLARDERATLAPGDVIGVGRSALVFRGA